MPIIHDILREERSNSLSMVRRYRRELAALPRGAPIRKPVGKRDYLYIASREGGKFRLRYVGPWSAKAAAPFVLAKRKRLKYRRPILDLQEQLSIIHRALREKKRRTPRTGR